MSDYIYKSVDAESDGAPVFNEDYGVFDPANASGEELIELRTAPFGPPQDRDNEPYNPGRHQYSSEKGSSYSTREPRKFFFLDEMTQYNTKDKWQSGPCDNDPARDHVSEHAGYWTSPGGESCDWQNFDGPGDPHKPTTFSMTIISNKKKNLIYNIGHGDWLSTSEGVDYGVVGISGHIGATFDLNYRDRGQPDGYASVGIQHIYCMYRADIEEDEIPPLVEEMQEMVKWFGEIDDIMSEVFPNGIPENLEEQLEAAMNANNGQNQDQNSEVGGYSTRTVNSLFTYDRLENLKSIRFEKNDTTIKILEMLKELMGRSFDGNARIDKTQYNPDVTSDYIMTLFKTPAEYDFDEDIIDIYSEDTELITGVELLMWYFHEFFNENENIDSLLSILQRGSTNTSGNRVPRDFLTERVASYWTFDQEEQPKWDQYGVVTYYDGFDKGLKYHIHNANEYRIALWWSDPNEELSTGKSKFGGIIDPEQTIEVPPLGTFLKIAAVSPDVPEHDWGRIFGRKTKVNINESVASYGTGVPDMGTPGFSGLSFKIYNGLGYYQHRDGQKPKWGAIMLDGLHTLPGTAKLFYHQLYLDPAVEDGKNSLLDTPKGHNTPCTWSLPCRTQYTDIYGLARDEKSKYILYLPKNSPYKRVALWVCNANLNLNGETTGKDKEYQWEQIKIIERGNFHEFEVRSNLDPKGKIDGKPYSFYRIGVLPDKKNGRHHFEDPTVSQTQRPGKLPVVPPRGIETVVSFWPTRNYEDSNSEFDMQQYVKECNIAGGTVQMVDQGFTLLPDGRKMATFQCDALTAAGVFLDEISLTDDMEPANIPVTPQKPIDDVLTKLPAVNYNDDPGTWRQNGGKTGPRPGERHFYYIKDRGYIIYWNSITNSWVEKLPSQYRYETLSANKNVPTVLESDKEGDFCMMRTPWGQSFSGIGTPAGEIGEGDQFGSISNSAGYAYIFLDGRWYSAGNIVAYRNTKVVPSAQHEFEFIQIHDNANLNINYDDPDNPGNNLHVNNMDPNYMLYVKGDGRNNNAYSDKNYNFVGYVDAEDPELFDKKDIYMHPSGMPMEKPMPGRELVWVEKVYKPPYLDNPGSAGDPDYADFIMGGYMVAWIEEDLKWHYWPSREMKEHEGKFTVSNSNPTTRPTQVGQYHVNKTKEIVFVSWRTAKNSLVNDGYEYEWQRINKKITMVTNDTQILRQREADGDMLHLGYRKFGGIHDQLICGNTNGDNTNRHMHLIVGSDGSPDAEVDVWRYFKTQSAWTTGRESDVNKDDVYYDYIEQRGSGSRVYRTTYDPVLNKVNSVDIDFSDTYSRPVNQEVSLLPPGTSPHVPGDIYKNVSSDNYPSPEGAFAVSSFLPSQILEPRDSGTTSHANAGIVTYSDETGYSYEKFAELKTIIETDHRNIDGDGQTGVPTGTYTGLDNDPFLIYKNPDGRGDGPLWKYFSQTSNGTPVGWKIIVGGRVSDGRTDESAYVSVGTANGDYDSGGGTGGGGGAGTGGEASDTDRNDLGYRSRSTGTNNSTTPSGEATGSDYYDQDQREYVRRRDDDINRSRRLPNVDSPSISIGNVFITNKEDYDFSNKKPADGTPGKDSKVPNYDLNTLYILTYDENRNRVFKEVGTLYDSGDRTGVTNNPPNLSSGAVFVKDNKLEVVTDSRGTSTYTTLTGDDVAQNTQDIVTEESHPPQPIVGRGAPVEAPGPLEDGETQTDAPPLYTNSSTQYTEAETVRPTGPNTASEIKMTDSSAQTARSNSFIWRGERAADGASSLERGVWIDLSGANFTFGPILPNNEPTSKNDGDIHVKTATSTSREGTMFVRQDGEMVRGPGGSDNEDTIPIVRRGDPNRYRPASAPGDLRVRIQEADPDDPDDDTETRVVLDVATSVAGDNSDTDNIVPSSSSYLAMISGDEILDDEEIIEVPNEYELPNTRYYYGSDSNRPDWAIYDELWTWELEGEQYVFYYEDTNKTALPILSRHPSDEVTIWSSDKNSADPNDWTKVGNILPGKKLTHKKYGLNPGKAYYRVAVKKQKTPNSTLPENEWNTKGYKIPVGACLDVTDPTVKNWVEKDHTGYNPETSTVEAYVDDNTGQIIKIIKKNDGSTLGVITYQSFGGWEKQIVKKGPGAPPKENEGEEEVDEDGSPLNSYGPEVTIRPQGMSEVRELPKLKNKIGDALYLKDKNGRGKVYVYDGKEGNDGWALVGTKRCPNTKNPGPGDYPGHPHWYPSRNKPYVWDGQEYVNPLKYHPKDDDGNDIIPDGSDDSGDKEIEIEPGDAVGIIAALAEVSAYAAIFAGAILAAKAVGAIWLKKMETDFLAECTEFEAGHELPIGLGSSDVDTFCKWYDLNHKFINMTIKPELRLLTQLLRCRFNGYMFHLAHVGPGKQDIRQLKVHSVVPTYSWGLLEMRNHRVLRVIREFSRNSTRSSTESHQWGVQVDKSIRLDTRKRLINQQGVTIDVPALDANGNNIYNDETGQLEMTTRPWMHTDAWFKPQTSVCLRTTGQDYVYTKARERYQIGDVGLEWIKAEGTSSGHPEVSGMNKHRTGPGLYMMNIFNDIGAGSKYYEHYNTDNSSHAWVWECLAHEPKPWPIGFTEEEMSSSPRVDNGKQVGIEFDLGSINVNKDQPRAARDWQINFIHLSFEDQDGKMKSIKVMPSGGYTFRNSEAFGTPSTHVMGQLENDQYRRITCWSNDTINVNDKFWGFAVNAWIGTEYAADRWRCYNMKNLKPLVRDPQ